MSHTVIFDDQCSLCVHLAQLMARKSATLTFEPWSEFFAREESILAPLGERRLAVYDGKELHYDAAAWQLVLEQHPALSDINWLAAKLGLSKPLGRALRLMGQGAKRFCFSCRR